MYKYRIYRDGRKDLAYTINGIAIERGFSKCQAYLIEMYGELYLGLRPFTSHEESAGRGLEHKEPSGLCIIRDNQPDGIWWQVLLEKEKAQ